MTNITTVRKEIKKATSDKKVTIKEMRSIIDAAKNTPATERNSAYGSKTITMNELSTIQKLIYRDDLVITSAARTEARSFIASNRPFGTVKGAGF